MVDALVIAGCLSGEKDDAGIAALVEELAEAVGADVTVRARTGGRPVGRPLPEALGDLRRQGVRRALVATTHVADGRLQREAASAVRAAAALVSRADALCAAKLADSLPSLFILAAFCGVLMYLGVSGFQHFDSPLGRYGAVFLAVTVFILSGFEHCIADMFYYGMAGVWGSGRAWLTMLVMVLGNGAGSVAAAELYRLSQSMME